jgi:hypothetical protein
MVSPITSPRASNTLAGLSTLQTTPSASTDSFTQQLASALEGYLAKSGNSSNLQIDIQTTQSQDSGVRQFLVTVKNPDGALVQTPASVNTAPASAASSSVASDGTTFPGFASIPAGSIPAASANNTANVSKAPDNSASPAAAPMTEADAYWAAQPPEVQQLRDVTDFATRSAMAQQLADQGFTIDKAIMVWGWDPLKTMLTRQMYGYTWAPNMNQGNVSTPGITLIGQTPYDPKNAPAGSIAVNTGFAKGTKISDAWCASQLNVSA